MPWFLEFLQKPWFPNIFLSQSQLSYKKFWYWNQTGNNEIWLLEKMPVWIMWNPQTVFFSNWLLKISILHNFPGFSKFSSFKYFWNHFRSPYGFHNRNKKLQSCQSLNQSKENNESAICISDRLLDRKCQKDLLVNE